jgi:rhomboid protease GluP|tara:strand:- start:49 stop:783 length:735 start_codon:yes stop_codon:yes gene_type:complete
MFLGFRFKENPIVSLLLLINLFYFLVLELNGGSDNWLTLVYWGAKEGVSISRGEYWRLLTPIFMHIGFFHLVSNTIALIIFGPIMEKVLGSYKFLIIYIIAGAWGNIASFLSSYAIGAGASGALFGLAGFYAAYLFINRGNLGDWGREALVGLGWIIGINLIFGFTMDGIDNSAHLGGLVSGWVMGMLLCPLSTSILITEQANMQVFTEKKVTTPRSNLRWMLIIIINILGMLFSVNLITKLFY